MPSLDVAKHVVVEEVRRDSDGDVALDVSVYAISQGVLDVMMRDERAIQAIPVSMEDPLRCEVNTRIQVPRYSQRLSGGDGGRGGDGYGRPE